MRRSLNLLVLVLLIPVLLVFGVTASADTLSLIPRRVFFSQTSSVESIDEERQALTGALVDYLYTTIAALQPIVRVEESERAHSSVLVDLARDGEAVKIQVALRDKSQIQVARDFHLVAVDRDLDEYTAFINETARVFAPYLELVKPEVREVGFSDEKAAVEIVQEIDFTEKLNKRFEITLWLSGLTQVFHDPTVAEP